MSEKKKVTKLAQIVAGKTSLLAKGLVTLKVGEKDITLPIKSVGIVDVKQIEKETLPAPPTKTIKVEKGSVYDTQFHIPVDDLITVHNSTDIDYLEAYAEHATQYYWQTAIQGLDIQWYESDEKTLVTEFSRKKEILEETGITDYHVDQIVSAVNELVGYREERADFLSDRR